ncbi:PD-(D/E)XK nuclease superfamily protein [Kaistella chaponensis]|uniref:PD-(D/E)XK nuclease superfamily protein n=1 Tax=Kaistella chaponensis TaxID=713588 RepID=A0A1N7M230_9FLAO|nr:PD-(D/E)XK nuclease family protein [Kaistella chaponensis]SIS80166.1 PD-(D/E)XK nuclease superfamily protein [Kaistella chaponensis]
MEIKEIESALDFSISLENRIQKNFGELLILLEDFNNIFEIESEKLPYHINLIDELHADENAHSRIFAKLLRYKKNNKYPLIEGFLHDVCGFEMTIIKPVVEKVDSCGRIDIPIFDTNYVVLIENKVTDKAPDQNTEAGGQLARYIETIKNSYRRSEKDIFVVYTPKYSREPSAECWINKDKLSYKDSFKLRFKSVSYRDDIYPWLKDKILPFEEKDIYLQSAIAQYIDHLEGLFSIRTINKAMNMRLQEFLKEQLNLEGKNSDEAIKILNHKKEDLENAIAQIELLKFDYRKKNVVDRFNDWKQQIIADFPNLKIVEDDPSARNNVINLGVIMEVDGKEFSALVECIIGEPLNIYFGISPTYTNHGRIDLPDSLAIILRKNNLGEPEKSWYGWRHTSLANGYVDLKNIIEKIKQEQQ